ncbi:MAG: hypothetical protein HYY31_05500 [Chloroflexi bacterium]|nr:hypothetical protein [Chloroflexota bacterium]
MWLRELLLGERTAVTGQSSGRRFQSNLGKWDQAHFGHRSASLSDGR